MRPWGDSATHRCNRGGRNQGESWVGSMTISPYRRAPGYILPTKLGKQKKQSLKIALRIRVVFFSLLRRWSLLTFFLKRRRVSFTSTGGPLGSPDTWPNRHCSLGFDGFFWWTNIHRENGGETLGMVTLNQPHIHLLYWVFIGYIISPFWRAPWGGETARVPSEGYHQFPYHIRIWVYTIELYDILLYLVVSTQFEKWSKMGIFLPQVGVKINNLWKHKVVNMHVYIYIYI